MIDNDKNIEMARTELLLDILHTEGIIDSITFAEMKISCEKAIDKFNINALIEYSDSKNTTDIDFIQILHTIWAEGELLYTSYKVVVSMARTRIRGMIGKWYPPVPGQMKIEQAIDSIIDNITSGTEGVYYYHTGKPKSKNACGKFVYKLVIRNGINLFFDSNRRICYHIRNN